MRCKKGMRKKYAAVLSAAVLFFTAGRLSAMPQEFKDFLKDRGAVKIYIEIDNSSEDDKIDSGLLKKLLEEAFKSRRSHEFVIVKTADESDIVLKGIIVEYAWQETDPLDQVWGAAAVAMDAAASDNYARMQVDTQIVKPRHNRILWSDRVQANVTKHVMPKDTSYELVYPRFVKSLMTLLFKKGV